MFCPRKESEISKVGRSSMGHPKKIWFPNSCYIFLLLCLTGRKFSLLLSNFETAISFVSNEAALKVFKLKQCVWNPFWISHSIAYWFLPFTAKGFCRYKSILVFVTKVSVTKSIFIINVSLPVSWSVFVTKFFVSRNIFFGSFFLFFGSCFTKRNVYRNQKQISNPLSWTPHLHPLQHGWFSNLLGIAVVEIVLQMKHHYNRKL